MADETTIGLGNCNSSMGAANSYYFLVGRSSSSDNVPLDMFPSPASMIQAIADTPNYDYDTNTCNGNNCGRYRQVCLIGYT